MNVYEEAKKYEGVHEIKGSSSNPEIVGWIKDNPHAELNDEVAWCSAFVNFICKECGYERSHSNRARRWLNVGRSIPIEQGEIVDIVILKSKPDDPGKEDRDAHGHVGFFVNYNTDRVYLFGGNQKKHHNYGEVCEKDFDIDLILDIRRLSQER